MPKPLIAISRKKAVVFACFLVLYEFLTYIANDMIMPGMLEVVKTFHAPESDVATSLTLYMLGGASLQLILGPVSDAYGRRPMMLLGAFVFFLFTLLIASSQTMEQFLTARFLQGMGLCFIGVIGYATLQEIFAEMDAIRFIAIMANAAILAPLMGPLAGAIIIHYTSWRIIFIAIALGALFAFWGLWRYMPEPIGKKKTNGEVIRKIPFSLSGTLKNYWALFTNPAFCYAVMAMGIAGVPCIAWIGLAPIIFMAQAKTSVIVYGLWQLPVFGATIAGNYCLHRLTYKYSLKKMVFVGCIIFTVSTLLLALLPYFLGEHYYYLLPGIIIYFFSLSIINAPLNRFCLFITPVSKGTASAIISLSVMVIGGLGLEVANVFYQHTNLYFGLYCLVIGALFLILISLTFWFSKTNALPTDPKHHALQENTSH